MKKPVVYVVTAFAAGFLFLALYALVEIFGDYEGAKQDEQHITELIQRIPIGASPEKVRDIFDSIGGSRLKLRELDSAHWVVQSPMQFGAANWDLWIYFGGQKVESLKIRLADSKTMHPSSAPTDKT